MRKAGIVLGLVSILSLSSIGCVENTRSRVPTAASPLGLDRVVLYRNGVGYFERRGVIEGNVLRLKVRKDQVNDLLKSLTIVDRRTGQAVSVSMPLDPDTWANAALATLAPGRGSLAEVLDQLRGVDVVLDTTAGTLEGRIVMVEYIEEEPDPLASGSRRSGGEVALGRDHRVTVMDGQELQVVRLSKVQGVTLKDGDLALQLHRRLDATAGEGMFQQIELAIRLAGDGDHDLAVSYVVEAPMWKPTYRVVLPEEGKGEALLQGWAVVDNTSGEDWSDVSLSLTAGAPLAFRYDLHSPRRVFREDLSHTVTRRRARVAVGETSYTEEEEGEAYEPEPAMDLADAPAAPPMETESRLAGAAGGKGDYSLAKDKAKKEMSRGFGRSSADSDEDDGYGYYGGEEQKPAVSFESLQRTTQARTKASQAAGLTRYDIQSDVTVPDGNATMVAIVNQPVTGEEAFLFDPLRGSGVGYENNPYRVVRFKNTTPFVLEPGPISIYSGGSFVGEGISETVGSGASVTVPFAVETGIMVTRASESVPEELKLLKIVRGVLEVERFHQVKTKWDVRAQTLDTGFKLFIRHPKYGADYILKDRPADTEDLTDAYLVPVVVAAGQKMAGVELVEQTPTKTTISIADNRALSLLERALTTSSLSAEDRAKLEPVIQLRREIGKLETEIDARQRRQGILERQMSQARRNMARLKDMKGAEAQAMLAERARKLEEWTREFDEVGRELLTLEEKREQKSIQLDELLSNLTIQVVKE